ncbi:MAG: hypothetical protein WBF73_14110 [Bradyrhizobium sp.]
MPDGRQLVSLRDAGDYITKLPKAEHEAPEWQAAMEALIWVATQGGATMFARIGVMQALNRHHVREFDLDRKPHHGGNGSSRETNDHLDYLPGSSWVTCRVRRGLLAGFVVGYLLGSSWVICWHVTGLRPYPDFAPCFAARLASSRNVFAIAACLFAFRGRRSSSRARTGA